MQRQPLGGNLNLGERFWISSCQLLDQMHGHHDDDARAVVDDQAVLKRVIFRADGITVLAQVFAALDCGLKLLDRNLNKSRSMPELRVARWAARSF